MMNKGLPMYPLLNSSPHKFLDFLWIFFISSMSVSLKIREDYVIWEGPVGEKMGFFMLGEKWFEKRFEKLYLNNEIVIR